MFYVSNVLQSLSLSLSSARDIDFLKSIVGRNQPHVHHKTEASGRVQKLSIFCQISAI